jgi:hypothetical protein
MAKHISASSTKAVLMFEVMDMHPYPPEVIWYVLRRSTGNTVCHNGDERSAITHYKTLNKKK